MLQIGRFTTLSWHLATGHHHITPSHLHTPYRITKTLLLSPLPLLPPNSPLLSAECVTGLLESSRQGLFWWHCTNLTHSMAFRMSQDQIPWLIWNTCTMSLRLTEPLKICSQMLVLFCDIADKLVIPWPSVVSGSDFRTASLVLVWLRGSTCTTSLTLHSSILNTGNRVTCLWQ